MIDEGFGSPSNSSPSEDDVKRAAKYRMAQADEALLRLCRLCVSIKVHTQNMSIDEATKFFRTTVTTNRSRRARKPCAPRSIRVI
jgi:Uncharacterized protein conserved in bacteria